MSEPVVGLPALTKPINPRPGVGALVAACGSFLLP